MKKFLLGILLVAGCQSVSQYRGPRGDAPKTREVLLPEIANGEPSWAQRFTRMVYLTNPTDDKMYVHLDCGWDSQWDFTMDAMTTQAVMTRPQRWKAYRQSCYVTEWRSVRE